METIESLKAENDRLKAELDGLKAQEPKMDFQFKHIETGQIKSVSLSHQEIQEKLTDDLYDELGETICRCESIGETNVVECNCESYFEKFELTGYAPIPAQQSPAVAVPDGWEITVRQLIDTLYRYNPSLSVKGPYHVGDRKLCAEAEAILIDAKLSPRITEQDAREIAVLAIKDMADQFREGWPDHIGKYYFMIGYSCSIEGRALLAKLNGVDV